jgi:hypothetical protein
MNNIWLYIREALVAHRSCRKARRVWYVCIRASIHREPASFLPKILLVFESFHSCTFDSELGNNQARIVAFIPKLVGEPGELRSGSGHLPNLNCAPEERDIIHMNVPPSFPPSFCRGLPTTVTWCAA